MARTVPEWIASHDDQAIPPRVRLRVFEHEHGKCHRCNRKITPGEAWSIEHVIALANGGQHREGNMAISCGWCKPLKDAEDVKLKAKGARVRAKHFGLKRSSRGFPARPKQHSATRPIVRKNEVSP